MNDQKHARGRNADRADWCFQIECPLPRISVRNLRRKIRVNVGELETFAAAAVQHCLQLRNRKRSDLRKLREIFNSLIGELKLYMVHGLLHLHGFDDQTPGQARKMRTAQEDILRVCGRDR